MVGNCGKQVFEKILSIKGLSAAIHDLVHLRVQERAVEVTLAHIVTSLARGVSLCRLIHIVSDRLVPKSFLEHRENLCG